MLLFTLSAISLLAGSGVSDQAVNPGQIALHPDVVRSPDRYLHIQGQTDGRPIDYVVTRESPNLPSNIDARSVLAMGRWEVCDGFLFSGDCKVIEGRYLQRREIGLRRIWSARPAD